MTYISTNLRRLVFERADYRCEYCHIRREDHVLPFEVDHMISEKHGGDTSAQNLCLSCWDCNNSKGSNIAGADPLSGAATFLYQPRVQSWEDHFSSENGVILPLTAEGRVTLYILKLNTPECITERQMLVKLSQWP